MIWARFKPTKIRPDEVIVTLRTKEEDNNIATSPEAARLVTYLSHETTSAWNSGYLLRRLKRQYKRIYVRKTDDKKPELNYDEAQKLVQNLALLAFDQYQQPVSTAIPMLDEGVIVLQ